MAGACRQILFVHGQFFTHRVWDGWRNYFGALGIKNLAPPWPDRNASKIPRPFDLDDVVRHYAQVIEAMAAPPIIIGHSMGGLVTQMLIQLGLGALGVAIAPVPPQGVRAPETRQLESTSVPYMMPFKTFQHAFVNDMEYEAQKHSYDTHVFSESLPFERRLISTRATVDFRRLHSPLLFIAGGLDRRIPADVNRRTFERYKQGSSSVVDFELFGNSSHLGLLIGRDWQLVADAAGAWADRRLREIDDGTSVRSGKNWT